MKTQKHINTLKRGEIIEALQLTKLGSLIKPLRYQLEHNVEFADVCFEDRIASILYEVRDDYLDRKLDRLYHRGSGTKPVGASAEKLSYKPERNLNREVVKTLLEMDWVRGPRPYYVTISGETGTGKSYLAEVLVRQACAVNLNVGYYTCESFIKMTDGLTKGIEIDKCFNALNRKDLIVIEDFGLFPTTEASIQLLFRLIDRRFGMGALLITSQYKVGDWYGYFAGEQNNNALADAVMDRLRNNSQNIELKGPSLRGTNPRI